MKKREIGVAVIGSGRIGSLRAGMASRHPSVNFLALSDKNKTKADILAQKTGADFVTDNNLDAISDARVDAVVVEKVLNHELTGMMRIYNQHDYMDERRSALDKWSKKIKKLIEDKS